eukprot:TRINITY_DN12796_c0_g1_i3.p1 TRINITY_DN12796_c0_g1~~TRINITY_DN12796_c0_g1_i3.p1  ORF type:complete len:118 (+),score=13.15 TRINITY_DN12796_c0_g1_i3:1-354(+)
MEFVCTGALRSVSAERVRFNTDAILGAVNLAILVLVHEKLRAIPPQLFALTSLTVLDLSSNQLSGPIPPELFALTSLTGFYLPTRALRPHEPHWILPPHQSSSPSRASLDFTSIPTS